MSRWCPWYARTGEYVRHKRTGKVGEIIWRHTNGRDVQVALDDGGDVTWFGENIEPARRSDSARRCQDCGVEWDGNSPKPTACHPELGHDWGAPRTETPRRKDEP